MDGGVACQSRNRRHSSFVIRHSLAFSLLEILVAVGLLSVIIVGLLAMFYQTEKAFRMGTRQADVLESGRSVMELLVRELQELTRMNDDRIVNLYASTNVIPLVVPRKGQPQVNVLQDYYFAIQSNDMWTGIGYYVDPVGNGGVGTLYRYASSEPGMFTYNLTNLYFRYTNSIPNAPTNPPMAWHRVADNIIHLRLIPYDDDGRLYTNINLLSYIFPYPIAANQVEYSPSSVDLELGILEPRALEKYRAITDPVKAEQFLTNSADKVHIFRQRIPIRTGQ